MDFSSSMARTVTQNYLKNSELFRGSTLKRLSIKFEVTWQNFVDMRIHLMKKLKLRSG